MHLLGCHGWVYLAQCIHDPQGDDRLRLDACELANGVWHTLLDTALDPNPLMRPYRHARCRLTFVSPSAGPEAPDRLRLDVLSPRGSWRFEQTEIRPLSPWISTSAELAATPTADLDEEAWRYQGGTLRVRHATDSARIVNIFDLGADPLGSIAMPRDLLESLDASVAARISMIAVQGARLYAAVPDDEYGFTLWCADITDESAQWRALIERGAERFVHNRQVFALVPHDQRLFIAAGTAPEARHPESAFFDYQGFELLRLDGDDEDWELLAGVPRVSPTGLKLPLSVLGPGLGARRRYEWCFLHAQAGHLILGARDEEGLRPWRSPDGERWEALAPGGLELIQEVERTRVVVCGPRDAVLVLDAREFGDQLTTRLWRLDFSALDGEYA